MLNRLVAPVSSMQGIGQAVSTSLALFGRIFDVLDLPVEVTDAERQRRLRVTRGEVRFDRVRFAYEDADRPTLDDISFVAEPGTMTAIVGATGSGKTSLAYLLTRLYEPDGGTITIDGQDIGAVSLDSLAANVGLVAQETYLLHASVRDNLRLVAPDGDRRRHRGGGSGGAHSRPDRRTAGRVRHHGGRARLPVLRWRAATPGDRPDRPA